MLRREISVIELELGRAEYPETAEAKPATRADCESGPRPCPWRSCRHHLGLSVAPGTGTIFLRSGDEEEDDRLPSCSLDVAEQGGLGQDQVGEILNLTGEAVRLTTNRALRKVGLALFPEGASPDLP